MLAEVDHSVTKERGKTDFPFVISHFSLPIQFTVARLRRHEKWHMKNVQ
jgi:hypothetical protein